MPFLSPFKQKHRYKLVFSDENGTERTEFTQAASSDQAIHNIKQRYKVQDDDIESVEPYDKERS